MKNYKTYFKLKIDKTQFLIKLIYTILKIKGQKIKLLCPVSFKSILGKEKHKILLNHLFNKTQIIYKLE